MMKFTGSRAGILLVMLMSLVLCREAVAQTVRPQELDVQFHRAETAFRSGSSMLEAKARVDRVLEALPDDVGARKLRAQVLLSMGRPAEAFSDAQRAVALGPDDGEAYLILSEAARMTGRPELAEEALMKASERVLEDAGFHIRLSWNAALLGQLDMAEAYARIALALDPREAAAYYQLARVFVQKSQPADAASVLARGLRQSVLDPSAIRQDTLLNRVSGDGALQGLLR